MPINERTARRGTAVLGAACLLLTAAAGLPTANAAPPLPAPASSPLVSVPGTDMARIAEDATYTLSPQLAEMLDIPVGTVLDATGLQSLRTAARPTVPGQPTPAVGTTLLWPALDITEAAGPVGIYLKPYTLRGVGDKIEVWVASGSDDTSAGTAFPAGDCRNSVLDSTTITDSQAQSLVREFDTNIYPAETKAFSTPPQRAGTFTLPGLAAAGVDFTGDGDNTVTLVDNVRDENFYDFPKNQSYVAGFFAPVFNQLTDRNVMSIDAFDWAHRTGVNPADEPNKDLCKSRPARPRAYEGVFAHEWQHLLQTYQDPDETIWINEGLSDYAISLVGYGDTRRTIAQTRAEGHIFCFQGYGTVKGPSNPNPKACGGPQNSLTSWQDEGAGSEVLADYGNVWSFVLFLADRYGVELISALHRDSARQGLASVQAALDTFAKGTKVAEVIHDYQLMNLLDSIADTKGATVNGIPKDRISTDSLNASLNLTNPAAYAEPGAAPNGADYVLLRANGKALSGDLLRSVSFTGARTVTAPSQAQSLESGGLTFALPFGVGPDTEHPVHNWHLSLVGIDAANNKVLVQSRTGAFTAGWTVEQLQAFADYTTVVAVVSHDNPDDLNPGTEQYARYTLTANGTTQRGG